MIECFLAARKKTGPAFREKQGQQKTIAENQGKIDEKLVTIAEALRLARIYSSRGGK